MSAWRGAKSLSTHTLRIAFSGFGLSSGLAWRLASVLKVVHVRGSPVPLAQPSPTKHGSRHLVLLNTDLDARPIKMSNDPTNREENMSRKPDPLTKNTSEAEKPPILTPKFLNSPISAHSPSNEQ